MTYTIEEHKHRFAAWAACRAASVNRCRFSVEDGKAILEEAGLNPLLIRNPDHLPNPRCFDAAHRQWREAVIVAARKRGLEDFTHGVAAKLINIYLKSRFVCGGHHNHARVRAIHPPIDSILLDKLYSEKSENFAKLQDAWRKAKHIRWSKFNSKDYEDLIQNIRLAMQGAALWEVEQYWQGYQ
jgi:hypothetical protein